MSCNCYLSEPVSEGWRYRSSITATSVNRFFVLFLNARWPKFLALFTIYKSPVVSILHVWLVTHKTLSKKSAQSLGKRSIEFYFIVVRL